MLQDRLIRLPEVMERTGVARSTVWDLMKKGKFPKSHKLSERVTVWKESEIIAYINSFSNNK